MRLDQGQGSNKTMNQHCLGKTNGVEQKGIVSKRKTSMPTGPESHHFDLFPAITREMGEFTIKLRRSKHLFCTLARIELYET